MESCNKELIDKFLEKFKKDCQYPLNYKLIEEIRNGKSE